MTDVEHAERIMSGDIMDPMSFASVDQFFSRLAERRNRENDLSDVTWAMCNAVPGFDSTLANFCDPSVPTDTHVEVDREVALGEGCRIDFACETPSGTVFIEVKIHDQNYHIEEYANRMVRPNSRLVLLTNHALDNWNIEAAQSRGWTLRHWREFAEHLKGTFPRNALIGAYLKYLRKVCNMTDLREIRLDSESLYSLVSLHAVLHESIGAASQTPFFYEPYSSQREHGVGWTGACFQLNYRQSDVHRKVWGFFGLDFTQPDSTRLEVWFDRDWNAELLKTLRLGGLADSKRVWTTSQGLGIAVADEVLREFLRMPLAEQRDMLGTLFKDLMRPVENHIASFSAA